MTLREGLVLTPTLPSQPNIIQVFEMRERPEVSIIMPYFPYGNIAAAGVYDESKFVTAVASRTATLSPTTC